MGSEENEFPVPPPETEDNNNVREELLSLAEAGEIKHSLKYLKKASQETLVKIKKDYDRKQLDVTNEFIAESLISKFSDIMKDLDMVENPDGMEKS